MAEEQIKDQQAEQSSAKGAVIAAWPNAKAYQDAESGSWAIFVVIGQTLGTRKWHGSEEDAWSSFWTDYPTRSLAGRRHTREQLRRAAGDQLDAVDEALKRADSAEREVAAVRIEATRTTCIWCGFVSEPCTDPQERQRLIAEHITACVQHPMNKALRAMCAAEQNLLTGRDLLRRMRNESQAVYDGAARDAEVEDEVDLFLADSKELPQAIFPQYTRNQLELQYRDVLGALRYAAGAYIQDAYKREVTDERIGFVIDWWLTRVQPAVAAANEVAIARAESGAGR